MSKPVVLTHSQWNTIFREIKKEYASMPSVFLLKFKMKSILGFSVREHTEYIPSNETTFPGRKYSIRLDFYNESKKTMFLLKYGDVLVKE